MSGPTSRALATDKIHCIDARAGLVRLPDESVDCVVTSPPYWGTRDYGVPKTMWPDGSTCALGLESDFQDYVEHLCVIFDEIQRVLKRTGTVWVNLGDTYAGSHAGYVASAGTSSDAQREILRSSWRRPAYATRPFLPPSAGRQAVQPRSLCQIPGRFAMAMTQRGWILRNDIVWYKPNHMPASVKNRLACSWEHLFLFVREPTYYFELDAVRVPHTSVRPGRPLPEKPAEDRPTPHIRGKRLCPNPGQLQSFHPLGKNPGDVWTIPTRPSALGHYAMFPEQLVECPIIAGCPMRVCARCKTPQQTRRVFPVATPNVSARHAKGGGKGSAEGTLKTVLGCKCKKGVEPGIVLDPFMGAGTTAVVAQRLGRRFIGFELNPQFAKMAQQRLAGTAEQTLNEKQPTKKKSA